MDVLIWGCGVTYNKIYSILSLHDINIRALISKNRENFILDHYRVILPEEIPEFYYDYIIVANESFNEIRRYVETSKVLRESGCTVDKLIPYYVFLNPKFDLEKYIKLKESRPSILSNFCIGGHLYKQWGLPFLSPTINMYSLGENYINFLQDYSRYLKMPMEQYEEENYIKQTIGREGYTPKGIIDNKVIWYLNHDIFPEMAINKWNERRYRVNDKNVIAIMTLYTDEEAYAFDDLNIEKKIGFYQKDLKLKSVVYLKEWEDLRIRHKYSYSFPLMVNALPNQTEMCNVDWLSFLLGGRVNECLRKRYINE